MHALAGNKCLLVRVTISGTTVVLVASQRINRERKSNPNFFFSNFSGAPGISQQNPGISRPKSLISLVSRGIPNFLAPTPSCGRPLPHRKISGLKSLGLGSFFVPESTSSLQRMAANSGLLRACYRRRQERRAGG